MSNIWEVCLVDVVVWVHSNLSTFNTSSVTSMSCMFSGCSSLNSLDLSTFNISSVTNMYDV